MISMLHILFLLSWVELRSGDFILFSENEDAQTKIVLETLESFHNIPSLVLFDKEEPQHPSIQVLLLEGGDYHQVVPRFGSIPRSDAIGFWQQAGDYDIVVLSKWSAPADRTQTIYHELTHHFVQRRFPDPPLWLSEGLAEYFEQIDIRGDRMILGRTDFAPNRVDSSGMSLSKVLQITKDSTEYRNPRMARSFYVQAHGLIHFLLHTSYRDAFQRYLAALTYSRPNLEQYLGISIPKLAEKLDAYFRSDGWKTQSQILQPMNAAEKRPSRPLTPAEAEAKLAEVLLWRGDVSEARRHVEKAKAISPRSPHLAYILNLLRRFEEAEAAPH